MLMARNSDTFFSSGCDFKSLDCENGFTEVDVITRDFDETTREMTGRSCFDYQEEWRTLFDHDDYISLLRGKGCKGLLRSSRFRSLCWKIFLECLPEERNMWIKRTWEIRQEYKDMQNNLSTNPRIGDNDALDLALNNPLSQEDRSPWNKYFQDSELQITIKQDVIRTFPEIDFFHTPEIQGIMVRILFCYARQYPDISYRQGMHELLAPLLFVLYSDQQALTHASEIDSMRQEIKELLDPEFIEPDAFFLFCQLMDIVEPWYVTSDRRHHKMEHLKLVPFSQPPENGPNSVIEVKLTKIHDQLLKRHDNELYMHLKDLEISPPIYGIRWLRLLFGREFFIEDLLVVWDAIFAESLSSDFVDYLFCSMLISIRDQLLASDYTKCLSYLMRYPPIIDVRFIIELALHMNNPLKCQKPANRRQLHSTITSPRSGQGHTIRPKTLLLNDIPGKDERSSSEPTTLSSKSPRPEISGISKQRSKEKLPTQSSMDHPEPRAKKVFHSRHYSANWEHLPSNDASSKGKKKDLIQTGGLSQSLGQLDTSYKEMVPLSTPNWGIEKAIVADAQDTSDSSNSVSQSRLHTMNDYCWRRMTLHLDRLQEGLLKQQLQNEDELLLAVAGLKRVRDILKGTLTFSQEVINDEECATLYDKDLVWTEDEDPWQIVRASSEGTNHSGLAFVKRADSIGVKHVRRNGPKEPLPQGDSPDN